MTSKAKPLPMFSLVIETLGGFTCGIGSQMQGANYPICIGELRVVKEWD